MTFPLPTPAEWRESAVKALKDRPLESLVHLDGDGLAVRPLYAEATGAAPVFAPRPSDAEGRAWDLRTAVEGDDAEAVNAAVLTDLEGGAASVLLSGAVTGDAAALGRALDGVALELAGVALDAGLACPAAADALAATAKGAPRARLSFHLDPISAWAAAGGDGVAPGVHLAVHLAEAAATAARHAGTYPEARLFLASGAVVHEAGGTAGQELGFAAAAAIAYIDAAVDAGLSVERALSGVTLGLSVDQQYFDGLAKVRALRLIWKTISGAYGHETPAVIEARSSRRMLAARDPWPNLLRLTAAGFAGAVGGADVVVLDGFTRAAGVPDAFARRQARNTQIVLMEEANLGRVDDPAAGSWFLDARTRDLAEAGWNEAQRIVREGGLVASVAGGGVQQRVAAARAAFLSAYADGCATMVGVTKFVDPDPRPAPVEDAPAAPAPSGRVPALTPVRAAASFEEAPR